MAGIKLPPAEEAVELLRTPAVGDFFSDDDPSAAENPPPSSDCSSDKDSDNDEEEDIDEITSMLGLQSYWDATYSEELTNFREHGLAGEIWFGPEVMDTVVSWTKSLCKDISWRRRLNHVNGDKVGHIENTGHNLSSWSVLDLGTGNGLLLQELAKHGFYNLTGVDYSEGAIELARGLADRDGFITINFLVDNVLETKLKRQFQLVTDKGTLDAIGLHPEGPIKRMMYWDSVSKLVAPGGIFVITSCNSTTDELIREVDNFNQRSFAASVNLKLHQDIVTSPPCFQYIDHVRSYPTFMFGGVLGSRVATVAFMRN